MEKDPIVWIEKYIGELPTHIRQLEDTPRSISYIKHTMYMLLSDETITEDQYAECQTWVTELENTY